MLPRPPFRKTKIIATIGPASDSPEMLRKMVAAGMNVARLNLSHGTFDEHAERVRRIRQAAEAAGRRLAVMIDTRGSEIRTGRLRNNYADLRRGAEFVLRTDGEPGDEHGVAVTYSKLPREVAGGDVILLDDGAVELEVLSTTAQEVRCRVVHGGILGNTKGVNLPGTRLSMTAVGPENRAQFVREIEFAAENDCDYIAASFIQSAEDIALMRELLDRALEVSGERTKKAAVTKALREFIARREQKRILELFGCLDWDADYDYKAERSRQ